MKHSLFFMLMACCVVLPATTQPKTQRPQEVTAEVPALNDFHEVIAEIWHTAWPEKNTKMLVELLPQVEKGAAAVAKAPLPGILHEREAKWGEGVNRLQSIVSEYKAATAPMDDKKLLSAAERLHMQYEVLAQIIRPALNGGV